MKKPILYTIAAISIAALAAIVIVGCNNGENSESEWLNMFLGSFVSRDPGASGGYKVTVENGNTVTGADTYAEGDMVYIMTDPVRDGQRFRSWTSSSEGVTVTNPENIITSFTMPPHAVTVTANFGAVPKYTVTYDGNENTGGSAPTDLSSPYDSGATVTVLGQGGLTKDGDNFNGWNTKRDGGDQFGENDKFTITESVTLYAKWVSSSIKTYKVTVTDGSGGGNYTPGDKVTIRAENKEGQTFTDWTSSSSITVKFDNANASVTTFEMPESDVTVTANFAKTQTYIVTVKSSAANATGSGSYAAGKEVTIFAGTAPAGQTFKSWTVNGNNVTLANSTSPATTFTMPANDVTVTANFEAMGSTVPTIKPSAPTNVKAEMTSASSITVRWDAVSNATGYVVYRSNSGVVYDKIGTVSGGSVTSYEDNTAPFGHYYFYKVSASNSAGESDQSSPRAYIAMVDESKKCGTYCYWSHVAGCLELVKDPTGLYNSDDYWPPVPTPTCDSAEARCVDAGGVYDNATCSGEPINLKNAVKSPPRSWF